jgi:hypothetical protein
MRVMAQEIPYNVMKKIEDVEIRQYPEVIFAVVEDNSGDSGFGLLFQYISGENKTRRKIAMTAPVITSEKITMTAPVITGKNYMAFALPSSYTKETAPIPTNPSVIIETQKEKTMAVLQFSGRTNETKVQKNIQKLITTLKNHSMQMKDEPVLMRYNSPFTPGFLRRNEVAVEIDYLT